LAFDPYEKNNQTGALILIDRINNATVAAGMILDRIVLSEDGSEKVPQSKNITIENNLVLVKDRQRLLGQKGITLWLTGLSGSGKSTIAKQLEKSLVESGHAAFILDGDNIRHGLNRDLGFGAEDRSENIRRISEVAKLFNQAGIIVITAFISPYQKDRAGARAIIGSGRFVEVFVDAPIEVCESRDPKGLYKKARAGEIPNFTGISDPYEAPENPEIHLKTSLLSLEESVEKLLSHVQIVSDPESPQGEDEDQSGI
jgi:bifunctional enzyme CysN/CysC